MPKTVTGNAGGQLEDATLTATGGKRHPLNMRTTAETRDKLEAAAVASGRSLAQEVEYRLNSSFTDEGVFPDKSLKLWAYHLTGVFHERGKFEAGMRGQPDMKVDEWMADPLIYQSAMFDVIRTLIRQQPHPERERVELYLEHLAGLFHNLRNDLLRIDPLKGGPRNERP
jgi:TraY domain